MSARPRGSREASAADVCIEPVVLTAQPEPITDQARQRGVEHFSPCEAVGCNNTHEDHSVIGSVSVRKTLRPT